MRQPCHKIAGYLVQVSFLIKLAAAQAGGGALENIPSIKANKNTGFALYTSSFQMISFYDRL
jgi:hypothetical protein